MDMKKIEVDVDVNRVIEGARRSFAETPNDILRRLLLESAPAAEGLAPEAPLVAVGELELPRFGERIMGHWQAKIGEAVVSATSLRDAYCRFIILAHQHDQEFLERFAKLKSRARRYVARNPNDLYLNSPHLAKNHAVEILPGTFIDSNLSESQIAQRARAAARELGLAYGKDAWIREETRTI